MKAKKFLNVLKSNKAKTLVLTGLMGLMPSCKMDKNAPDAPKTQDNTHNTYVLSNVMDTIPNMPVDSFMTHMPNVANAVFYEPTEDTHRFLMHTDNTTGYVNGVTEERDVQDRARYIVNPYNLTRIDNTSVNGSAKFITPAYWFYKVGYSNEYGGGDWGIECVSESQYNSVYANMTNQELANLAYGRLIYKHPEDTYHAEQIRNAILNNQGQWTQDEPFYVTFNSNGWQQNLKYSDFGTFDVSTLDYSYGFTSMFSGGLPSNETNKSVVQPQTFKTTAYGKVKYDNHQNSEYLMVVSTGRDSATFTIDALQNETIVMPFKNWYKVTIIRTNNSVVSTFENVDGTTIADTWQLPHPNMQETNYREGIQDNGLVVKDGFAGTHEDGILTGTAVNYYTDETGYIELVGQGYRQDRSQNKNMQFTFSFGGTNRPRPEEQITTGLENVYCAPGRQR